MKKTYTIYLDNSNKIKDIYQKSKNLTICLFKNYKKLPHYFEYDNFIKKCSEQGINKDEYIDYKKNNFSRIDELKNAKLKEIKDSWLNSRNNTSKAVSPVLDSNGFNIEADAKTSSETDIDSLIKLWKYSIEKGIKPKDEKEVFKDYHDNFHMVTLDEITQIYFAILNQGKTEYFKKEKLYAQIRSAKTIDELNKIKWN